MISLNRSTLLLLVVGVLAACETPPQRAPAPPPATVTREPEPAPPPPTVLAPPPPPVTAETRQQAQKVALAAVDTLETGNEDQARSEIKRALVLDPQNRLALSLTKQMTADPVGTLGSQSFPYTVKAGDSMSRIAGRYLNDVYLFYILARYNDIKVPRQLAAGQVIRVPGKAPPPGSITAPAPIATPAPAPAPEPPPRVAPPPPVAAPIAPPPPAPVAVPAPPPPPPPPPAAPEPTPGEVAMRNAAAAEKAGDLAGARSEYQKAAGLGQSGASAKAEQMRTQLVSRYSVNARSALTRQDLDGSIANWVRVLELDPDNSTAKLELDRVRGLKEKLKNVK